MLLFVVVHQITSRQVSDNVDDTDGCADDDDVDDDDDDEDHVHWKNFKQPPTVLLLAPVPLKIECHVHLVAIADLQLISARSQAHARGRTRPARRTAIDVGSTGVTLLNMHRGSRIKHRVLGACCLVLAAFGRTSHSRALHSHHLDIHDSK